jgi:hypothetical protein
LNVQAETAMDPIVMSATASIRPICAASAAPATYYYPLEVGTG